MRRITLGVLAVAALTLVLAAAAWSRSDAIKLNATTGPGFTVTLKKGTKKVKTLDDGTYKITVSDKSSAHDFALKQLSGGKFHKELTTVGFKGKKTVTVKLKKGKWEYYCTPHESLGMRGFFKVK